MSWWFWSGITQVDVDNGLLLLGRLLTEVRALRSEIELTRQEVAYRLDSLPPYPVIPSVMAPAVDVQVKEGSVMKARKDEGSAADKRQDRAGAKKAGMSLKKYEGSAADKKADAKRAGSNSADTGAGILKAKRNARPQGWGGKKTRSYTGA